MNRGGRERLAFTTAVAIVALHTIIDTFLAPQQGTRWNDHLAAGLVPLALLGAAVVLYPRLPVGARATVSAVLGVLALEGACLAVADRLRGPGRIGDWSGFLLAPVGAALCIVAVVVLWRSRKGGRRYRRRALLAVAAVLGTYWLVVPVAMALYATHRPRADVSAVNLGAPHRTVMIPTRDGLDLAAWYVRSRNGAAVISFPTRVGKLDRARMLIRHGYGVLVLDMRGYERSDGTPNAFGWGATKDIDAAVAWLRRQPDVRDGRIGGIGFSVGGEQMLEAAAGNRALRAVVSEGAGERSVRESAIRGPAGWFSLPLAAVQTGALAVLSDSFPPTSLQDAVAQIAPRPLFLIYAGRGGGGEELNVDFYRAAGNPKLIWKIPEAGHVGGLSAEPREYERRVIGFFDHALLPAASQ